MLPGLQRAAEAALEADLRLVDQRQGWRGPPHPLDAKQLATVLPAWRERLAAAAARGRQVLVWDLGRSPRTISIPSPSRRRTTCAGIRIRPLEPPTTFAALVGGRRQDRLARPRRRDGDHPVLRRRLGPEVEPGRRHRHADERQAGAGGRGRGARPGPARTAAPPEPGTGRPAARPLAGAGPARRGGAGGHRPRHPRRPGPGGRPAPSAPSSTGPPRPGASRAAPSRPSSGAPPSSRAASRRPPWSTTRPTSTGTRGPARSGSRGTSSRTSSTGRCC